MVRNAGVFYAEVIVIAQCKWSRGRDLFMVHVDICVDPHGQSINQSAFGGFR